MEPRKDLSLRKWASSTSITAKSAYSTLENSNIPLLYQPTKFDLSRPRITSSKFDSLEPKLGHTDAKRPVTAPAQGASRGVQLGGQIPELLKKLIQFVETECASLSELETAIGHPSRLGVYRQAMNHFARSFKTYEPFLSQFLREHDQMVENSNFSRSENEKLRKLCALAEFKSAKAVDATRLDYEDRLRESAKKLERKTVELQTLSSLLDQKQERVLQLENELESFSNVIKFDQSFKARCQDLEAEKTKMQAYFQNTITQLETRLRDTQLGHRKDSRLIESMQAALQERYEIEQNLTNSQTAIKKLSKENEILALNLQESDKYSKQCASEIVQLKAEIAQKQSYDKEIAQKLLSIVSSDSIVENSPNFDTCLDLISSKISTLTIQLNEAQAKLSKRQSLSAKSRK